MSCIVIVDIANSLHERLIIIAKRTDVFFTSIVDFACGEERARDRVDNRGCLRVTRPCIGNGGVRVTGGFDVERRETSERAVKERYATLIPAESVANEDGARFVGGNSNSRGENACNGESSEDRQSRKH
jgi:hypothetical protein